MAIKIESLKQIYLGIVGENQFRPIEIDMTSWMEDHPDWTPIIVAIRPGETKEDAYIAVTTFADNILTWEVSAADLGTTMGRGKAQIWLQKQISESVTKRGKTKIVATIVDEGIEDPSETVPAAQQPWIDQMTALKEATEDAAEEAEDSASDAEAYAIGKRGGQDVQPTDPAYHNNSKYFSQQAGTSATAAGEAQAAAAGSASDAEAYAIGKRGGQDVPDTDPAYHNNSKYFSQQASNSASAAGTAKTQAEAARDAAVAAMLHFPYVDPVSGNWMNWDAEHEQWVNTGIHAQGPQGETGQTGQTGANGQDAHVYIRYAANEPTADADMKTTPDKWIGIYSGYAATAPTSFTSYTWYKFKGETGSAANVYGTTVPMSENDNTKVATAIGDRANKVNGATNGNFAGLDNTGNLTDSGKKAGDFVLASDFNGESMPIADDAASKVREYIDDLAGEVVYEYDEDETYAVGEYCKYGEVFWRCNTTISTAEEFNSAHWDRVNVGEELDALDKTDINLAGEIGKVVKGNSCAGFNLNKNDYVIVKDSTINGIADGLYTYNSDTAKPAGNTVSSGELTAVTGGIANALNSKLTTSPWTAQYFDGAYNVNDFTTPGLYFLRGTISNAPYGSNGHLIVITAGQYGWKKQIWIRYGTSGTNDNKIYVRGENANGWGVWVEYDGSFVTT